eukprot:GEMP01049843.1.p3 GENE.GEMP01049843.1~~GEMP01049843.1.p3  ORF type:complete len:113 (-),score=5.53 GEMP01049843.1:65-403(-)
MRTFGVSLDFGVVPPGSTRDGRILLLSPRSPTPLTLFWSRSYQCCWLSSHIQLGHSNIHALFPRQRAREQLFFAYPRGNGCPPSVVYYLFLTLVRLHQKTFSSTIASSYTTG